MRSGSCSAHQPKAEAGLLKPFEVAFAIRPARSV